MGMVTSSTGRGPVPTELLNILSGTLYKKFLERNIQTFDEFHIAILDIFSNFNSALPGKHYDAPKRPEIERIFKQWEKANGEGRKKIFKEFMTEKVNMNKIDTTTMVTGVLTPPVAMAAKRVGENVPKLKMIKAIPDVLFVPLTTVVALFSIKISRRVLMGTKASR